jgi:glycosyltransferase involved in cell wall biosynthesis
MNILFVHQNFPAQFKNIAPALVKRGDKVVALSMRKNAPNQWQGIKMVTYSSTRSNSTSTHPWVADFESKVIRGEACYLAAQKLYSDGFRPDVIVAHPGWGESMFLKDIWPDAKLGIYSEFFYQNTGADFLFDPEFQNSSNSNHCRLRLKNANNLLHFEIADAGISPTHWQASTFPKLFKEKISVIHDGIDTELVSPNPDAVFELGDGTVLTKHDEVITFINRNLEPYRGYHIFMRALPDLLKNRPNAQILIVGGDSVSYGFKSPSGKSWKNIFIDEVKGQISDDSWKRVHFLGLLPYSNFIKLLQISTVHVYLTYPFVLSWSLLEAMSAGCAIVASDTAPVIEVIKNKETGLLFNFFDPTDLVESVLSLLDDPSLRKNLSNSARDFAKNNFELSTICLPLQLSWIDRLNVYLR